MSTRETTAHVSPSRGSGLSVVMPAFNEAENLRVVVPETLDALEATGLLREIIVVDDGSVDETANVLQELRWQDARVRGVRLRQNAGKSLALQTGLRTAAGEIIVLMDADGQDDPHEITRVLARLEEGLDLVTGYRKVRRDRIVKRLTSRIYNVVTARVTGVEGHDFNSGLKALRRDVADSLHLYGELHRYIPVLATMSGFAVGEVEVSHRPRLSGQTKYGPSRFWRGMLDLLTVKFLTAYRARPLHLFGGLGVLVGFAGSMLLGWMVVLKVQGEGIGTRPALLAGILLTLAGLQLLSLGLIAELFVHILRGRESEVVARELNEPAQDTKRSSDVGS